VAAISSIGIFNVEFDRSSAALCCGAAAPIAVCARSATGTSARADINKAIRIDLEDISRLSAHFTVSPKRCNTLNSWFVALRAENRVPLFLKALWSPEVFQRLRRC
jgi:hypothetical protein